MPGIKRRAGTFGGPRVRMYRRAIYRRARRGVTRKMIYGSMARRAGILATRAYPYGAAAYLGYRAIQAIRARRNRFSRTNIGEYVGTGTSKKAVVADTGPTAFSTRSLYSLQLTDDIIRGSGLSQRERDLINLRGFRMCMEFKNKLTDPLYVNVAVISPKGSPTVSNLDFFRAAGNTNNRGEDFDTNMTGLDYHCLNINTDKYTVLKHRRFRLNHGFPDTGAGVTTQDHSGHSYMNLDWYVPLKRQLRYDADTGSPVDGLVFRVMWFAAFASPTTDPVTTGACEVTERIVTYFRDPKV